MDEYRCVRCLFCSTGCEETVVKAIQQKNWGRAIFPQRVRTIRKGKEWIETYTPLLPGYVFVYSEQADVRHDEFMDLRHVIRVLSYGDAKRDTLVGRDLEFADWLWQLDGRIGLMKAVQIGDRVEIIDGIFRELHGRIVRMDKRQRSICVALETEGSPKQIWLAYEIVEKVAEERKTYSNGAGDGR